jgi:3-dehydroquinate synthase
MIENLTVGLGERSYPITFGNGILAGLGTACRDRRLGNTAVVITNPLVGGLYGDAVRRSLVAGGFAVSVIEIPDGEEYKNLETLKIIYDRLVDCGVDRGAFIVALGGGVVGDVAGYAAATFLRGIPFVQVPTTLLAQVDSSVGGKTGVNHEKGKNLIGAFYQPVLVTIDTHTLTTLPEREYLCGLAEVVKYGMVLDGEFFSYLEGHVPAILDRDTDTLLSLVRRCCQLKAHVVEQDERESGVRAVLNYGHTLGHAVETLTGYSRYKHGEAVAIGMVQAARLAESQGVSDGGSTGRLVTLLRLLGLPVELPDFSAAAYRDAIMHDKKVRDGGIQFVFNKGIGDFHFARITDLLPLLKVCGIGG